MTPIHAVLQTIAIWTVTGLVLLIASLAYGARHGGGR